MDYDRILKWYDDGKSCLRCYHHQNETCLDNIECGYPHDYKQYKNAVQLEGLIKEAESGAHKWVLGNTKFMCGCPCAFVCRNKNPHHFAGDYTCPSGNYIKKPFRGTKGEKQTWPGKTGATHLEALKDLRERGLIHEATDEDCSEVEKVVVSKMEIAENKDRSDTNYTHNKEALKKAGEDAFKCDTCKIDLKDTVCEFIMDDTCGRNTDYARYEEKESEYMDVEYVVSRRDFTMKEMASTSINGDIFKYLLCKFGINWGWTKGVVFIDADNVSTEAIAELLRMGFIEEKVCDPVVNLGDCYKHTEDGVFRATWCGDWLMTFTRVKKNEHYGTAGGTVRYGFIAGNPSEASFMCKLSDLVGQSRLKEFTPCKVKVEIIEG